MDNQTLYKRWLTNAYRYYWGHDLESDMSDHEWDHYAKRFAQGANEHPLDYAEIANKNYTGGSLFWLSKAQYPTWAKE